MGFFCKFVRVIRVLQCALGMPASGYVISFFIVFGGGAMGVCRKFVLLGCSPVSFVHANFPSTRRSKLHNSMLMQWRCVRSEPRQSWSVHGPAAHPW